MSHNSPDNFKPTLESDLSVFFVDACSEVCNKKSSEEEFHDAPEMKEIEKKTKTERKLREPTVNLLALTNNSCEDSLSTLPRPVRSFSRKFRKLKLETLTSPKRKTKTIEEDNSGVKEEKRDENVRPISRDELSEKALFGSNLSVKSVRRPVTLTAARLEEIASGNFECSTSPKQLEGSGQKRPTSSPETAAPKKHKQVTFDLSKIDEIKIDSPPSERRPNSPFVKPRNPESEKNRDEEIEKIKQRIAATRLNLCSEKSVSSLNQKKGKYAKHHHLHTTPTDKSPDHGRKASRKTCSAKVDDERSDKLILKNLHLKNDLLEFPEDGNINSVEISCVEVRKEISPMSSSLAAFDDTIHPCSILVSDIAINTEQIQDDEELITLRKEKEACLLSNMCLKKDNDGLKEGLTKQQKRELDLKKEISSVSETLVKTNLTLKDIENKNLEKDNTIAQLRCQVHKLHDLSERLKEKDGLISELQNQNSGLKDENSRIKKELDRNTIEQQNLSKDKNSLNNIIYKLREERNRLESKISDLSGKILQKEKELTNIQEILDNERKQNAAFREDQDTKSSASIVNLSEQLLEKDNIISELEKLRNGVQLINKEVCSMLAFVFSEFGQEESETEIESLVSSGRVLTVKNNLIALIENHGRKGLEACHEECRKVIFNLEDRAAVLEAELEESKNYTENLAGVISTGKMWDIGREGQQGTGKDLERIGSRLKGKGRTEETVIGDTRNISRSPTRSHLPQNLYDLFVLLEGKRQALMKMERKVQELEDVHSKCNQKRVRNEMRISHLEMALAAVKLNHL